MTDLRVGDDVRVVNSASQWRDARGQIVEILERTRGDGNGTVQECAIVFGTERRWFMAEHLVKTIPAAMLRLFRAEVIDRWYIKLDDAACLDGSRDQLLAMLRDKYDVSMRRAEREVDAFLLTFEERIRRAMEMRPAGAPATGATNRISAA